MRALLTVVGAVVAADVASGCSSGSTLCPAIFHPPVAVRVRDAATGAPAADGASGTARRGDRVIELRGPVEGPGGLTLEATASGGGGVYEVRVQKPGYLEWVRAGVSVPGGKCGPEQPVVLDASLEPAG